MARTIPALLVVLAAMTAAAPAADARACKGKHACESGKPKKHKGVYNGGPGDPIIAPLPSLPG